MYNVRTNLLFHLATVDESVWNEPRRRVARVITEEKFTPNHLGDH